jgi:hypothetical protein
MPAYSVAAIEHNQAMMQGREGEFDQVKRVLKIYPDGIVSYVADTYDMKNFVNQVTSGELKEIIMKRDGTFVIRPDSSLLNSDGTEMSSAETIQEIFKIIETNLGNLIKIMFQNCSIYNSKKLMVMTGIKKRNRKLIELTNKNNTEKLKTNENKITKYPKTKKNKSTFCAQQYVFVNFFILWYIPRTLKLLPQGVATVFTYFTPK